MASNSGIYLNNAATSWPKAPGVAEAVGNALTRFPALGARSNSGGTDAARACRAAVAKLLGGVDPRCVILTSGATHALNLALMGLPWVRQARALTTVLEHNSVLRPLARLAARQGVEVVRIGVDGSGRLDLEALENELRRGAALVALTHISNVTGHVTEVAQAFFMAAQAGAVTLLDASQSAGVLELDPRRLGADLVAFPAHKALHGPPGTGVLYVRPGLDLVPLMVGGTGVRSESELHPEDMPLRLEAGTPNDVALEGFSAALRWASTRDSSFLAGRRARGASLWQALRDLRPVLLHTSLEAATASGIVSLTLQGWSVEEAGFALASSFGLVCRAGLHCAPAIHAALGTAPEGTLRLSVSGFTTESDVAAAVEGIRRLLRC